MILALKSLNKEHFYSTSLDIESLGKIEDYLKNIPLDEITYFFTNSNNFLQIDNECRSYDYIICLYEDEYLELSEDFSKNKVCLNEKETMIKERLSIVEAILEMFDTSATTEPITVANYTIKSWTFKDLSWINRTNENIVLFYSNIINNKRIIL